MFARTIACVAIAASLFSFTNSNCSIDGSELGFSNSISSKIENANKNIYHFNVSITRPDSITGFAKYEFNVPKGYSASIDPNNKSGKVTEGKDRFKILWFTMPKTIEFTVVLTSNKKLGKGFKLNDNFRFIKGEDRHCISIGSGL